MFKYLEMLLLLGFLYSDIWIDLLNHSVYIIYILIISHLIHCIISSLKIMDHNLPCLSTARGRFFLDVPNLGLRENDSPKITKPALMPKEY